MMQTSTIKVVYSPLRQHESKKTSESHRFNLNLVPHHQHSIPSPHQHSNPPHVPDTAVASVAPVGEYTGLPVEPGEHACTGNALAIDSSVGLTSEPPLKN